ncbi:membrane-anchored protein [Algimonas arctica]|uniref:Membrane-anchored protein n=1 Tax=Algimonas arctica TaxID=1479486 RepID=A0A8J3CQD5_9PROT|nr:polysaccharide pyruvyl transferase family protein [Algimonas arctica]GHA85436.1 membrane-anchored protein [Algimonas arctica]
MNSPKYLFLSTAGGIDAPATLSTQKLLKIAGENSGNFMFQYAADRLLGGEHVFVGESGIAYTNTGATSGASHLIVPSANHFRIGADWSGLVAYINGTGLPSVLLGLGAQAPKIDGVGDEFMQKMLDTPELQELARCLIETSTLITVRGEFSKDVCAAFGLPKTLPLGCPSLLINPNKTLGQTVQKKIDSAIVKMRDTGAVKLAFTAASPFEIMHSYKLDIERVLFDHTKRMNGIYIQQSGGLDTVAFCMRRFEEVKLSAALSFRSILDPESSLESFFDYMKDRARIFWDVDTWMAGVRPFDICIGTRLHGNMAALAADVPGIVITHDARTSELVKTMCLPYLDAKHCVEGATFEEMLGHVQFDADAFDENRVRIAKALREAFESKGLQPSEHLLHMSADLAAETKAA